MILTGSHAHGAASAESDVDLVVVGHAEAEEMSRRGGFLVSLSRAPLRRHLAAFSDPARVGGAIPGWRDAIILVDDGTAARLQARAEAWRWELISEAADRWVAGQVTGYAEEVHKLVAALDQGNAHNSAVQRSVLALHLAKIISVHHRILYGSENVMWDLVAERMGEPWASTQARALGLNGERFEETSLAALELYRIAAAEVDRTLGRGQRLVVAHACRLASAKA